MSRTIRIVNYAVNGSGVGHLQRLVAVNRWVRRYALHAGVRPEIYFLTSSEADGLLFAERFASFKLPSKTIVGDTGIDKVTYLALAKQWVWHSLGLLRPDLLVVDTFPRGSFGELLSALDLCRRRAFIYRPMKESFAARADFQAMLPLYDAILVPEEADLGAPIKVPEGAAGKLHHAGPVMVRERAELLPRAEVRQRLGVDGERLAIYVSAGGGGDAHAERQLLAVCAALRDEPDLHLIVGAGPLYRGRIVTGERITWLEGRGTAELTLGFDGAVCAAGYNTFCELMHAGVPAVFLPQDKIADDQAARAARAVAAGAASIVAAEDAVGLRAAVAAWRDPAARAHAAAAARGLVPRNHARDLAAELLRLVLPASAVEAAEEAIGEPLLVAARELSLDLETFVEVMHALGGAGDDTHDVGVRDAAATSGASIDLLRSLVDRGIPVAAGVRVVTLLARKLATARPGERAAAARLVLGELAPFADWGAAVMLLRAFTVERQLGPSGFAGELGKFLAGLRARGESLPQGIARLAGALDDGSQPTNRELLARASVVPPSAAKEAAS